MSKLPSDELTAFELSPKRPFQSICEQFEAAWQQALHGGSIPDADSFLDSAPESERAALKADLLRIARVYQQRLLAEASGTTVEVDSKLHNTDPDHSPQQATVDFPPEQKFDADATVDPETAAQQIGAAPQATVEPITQKSLDRPPPGGTMDFAAAQLLKTRDTEFSIAGQFDQKTGTPIPVVAGYEILSELGRGGMGVVYKARQLGLNRLVALKMVLAGAHAGEAQLARFHTEAEAVAHLLHPNIVQIYEVGNHEGLPYFSLEFVDGGCLADKIAGKPLPITEAAQLAEVLALAMSFAHQHGIIHRDLKPANVLMTRDGLPKITDFGLAKRLESDSSQTKSGTLMGTPSYMAPEQARGEIAEMGPLTDVYALGIILYEMLTGRTPFLGASVLETLEQVRTQEALPPSRLQPKIPRDIETICLKCLQKEPHKRYESAEALTRDLHHFLVGEPIEARPVGNAERIWRWCRRKPILAGLYASVVLLVLTFAIGGPVAALAISKERNEAVYQRGIAEAAKGAAERSADAEKKAREEATAHAKVASDQRTLALRTMYSVTTKLDEKLRDRPDMQGLQKEILDIAVAGLKEVSRTAENAALADRSMGVAHQRIGDIYEVLGNTVETLRQYQLSLAIFEKLAKSDPEEDWIPFNSALSYDKLGDISRKMGDDPKVALGHYRKALTLRQDLLEHPKSGGPPKNIRKQALAISYAKLGSLLQMAGDPAGARDHYEHALEQSRDLVNSFLKDAQKDPKSARDYAQARQSLAGSHRFLGEVAFLLRDEAAARLHYKRALELRQELLAEDQKSVLYKRDLAMTYGYAADVDLQSGKAAQALDSYTKAHELFLALQKGDPNNADAQSALSTSYYRTATARLYLQDFSGADRDYRESLKLREALVKADANNISHKSGLMLTQARCGKHREAAGIADELRKRGGTDPSILFRAACGYALCVAAVGHGKSAGQLTPEDRALQERYAAAAVAMIEQAIKHGYNDLVALEVDPDLEPVQPYSAYKELLKKAREKSHKAATAKK